MVNICKYSICAWKKLYFSHLLGVVFYLGYLDHIID